MLAYSGGGTLPKDQADRTIFLSYARGDDEPFVERLYRQLVAAGFDVWWDRVAMPNRA